MCQLADFTEQRNKQDLKQLPNLTASTRKPKSSLRTYPFAYHPSISQLIHCNLSYFKFSLVTTKKLNQYQTFYLQALNDFAFRENK